MRTVAIIAALLAASAVGGVASPTIAAATPSQTGTHLLRLVEQTPAVEPGGELHIRVRLTSTPPGGQLRVDVHARTLHRSEFRQTIEGKDPGRLLPPAVTIPAVPDSSGTVLLVVPTRDDSGVGDPAGVRVGEGVFPVTVTLVDSKGTTLDELLTYLIRLPANQDNHPFGVAIVIPVTGPPAIGPDGTVSAPAAARRAALDVATVLSEHPAVPVTLAVDPEVLDGLAASGGADTLTTLADTMSGREVAPATYVPLATTAWVLAGLRDELGTQLASGASAIRSGLGVSPGRTWIADDQLDKGTAVALAATGVRRIVVPERALAPLDDRNFPFTLTQPFDLAGVDGVDAVDADATLAAHVGETGDPRLDAYHLLADLAILFFDDPKATRAAAVILPGDGSVQPDLLTTLLAGVAGTRTLRAATIDDAFDQVPKAGAKGPSNTAGTTLSRSLTPAPADELAGFPADLRAVLADVATLAAVEPNGAVEPAALQQRTLIAGSRAFDDDTRRAYLDGVSTAVRDSLHRIATPGRQVITFTARDGTVALTLRNDTGAPARVTLIVRGTKLEFPDHPDGIVPVTLTDPSTRIELHVRTLASGDSPLDVTLTTPDRRIELGRTRITIRSTAFSGVGIILSVGALLFLVVWWARHIVADRRGKRRPPRHAAKPDPAPE